MDFQLGSSLILVFFFSKDVDGFCKEYMKTFLQPCQAVN
jgi:hypothetical protein